MLPKVNVIAVNGVVSSAPESHILLYIKRDDICIYICYHFTDTTASTLTRSSAKTVKDMKLKFF